MEQEIKEIIAKNLPQHVGDVLKTKLEQADKDAETVKSQRGSIDDYVREIQKLTKTIETYKELDQRNYQLDSREKELNKKENNLELEKLKYELQTEKDKTIFSQSVALGLVRNTEYRKTVFDNESYPSGAVDNYGNQIYTNTIKSYNKTTEIT